MIIKPPDNGFIEGALLVDAENSDSRKNIMELILNNGRLVMIKNKGNHLIVQFMIKSSGKPQWNINFWEEDRSSSITDYIEHARELAKEYIDKTEQNESPDQKPASRDSGRCS